MGRTETETCAANWLARLDAGQLNASEQAQLEAWLAESSANKVAFLRLQKAWANADRLVALQLPAAIKAPRSAQWGRRFWLGAGLAGSLILVVTAVWFGLNDLTFQREHYSSGDSAVRNITLADGSHIDLDRNTSLMAVFYPHQRRLTLEKGQAYFDIAHDRTKPFVIVSGQHTVTALGTRFLVRSGGGKTEVIVAQGKVRIDPGGPEKLPATFATRGDFVVANGDLVVVSQRSAEQIAQALRWRVHRIVFRDAKLGEVARELNEYNVQQLIIASPAVADMRLGGALNSDDLDALTSLLRENFGLTVHHTEESITISQ
jgi:transmembrane sensor